MISSILALFFIFLKTNLSEEIDCGVPSVKPTVFGNTLNRVIFGENAVQGSWPWVVSLRSIMNDGNLIHFCGASLIDVNLVLTAAHCLEDTNVNNFVIVAGTYNVTITPDASNIYYPSSFKIHSQYNTSFIENGYDIALIKLKSSVNLSDNVKLVCLPNPTDYTLVYNKDVYTVGW